VRSQSTGEEIANSVTHAAALLASIAAFPVLVLGTVHRGDAGQLAAGVIFGATLVLLYLASTLYHAWRPGRVKHALRILDHSAIYLLIAGTYTPFTVGVLRGPWGWTLLAVIWTLALLGILTKCTLGFRRPALSTGLYMAMGWLIVVALRPLVTHLSTAGIAWLIGGGICYTSGVAFYAADDRLRYSHALWHLFVAAGSSCHFVAVLRYAA
jgi:hemolysin III